MRIPSEHVQHDPRRRFVIYARKSMEAEDRQVLSIESQIEELKRLTTKLDLPTLEILSEARSAKAPGRPIFGELMRRVSAGRLHGILCWKLDRLARNPVDGGALIWALKQHGLHIVTPTQTFGPEDDNKILMYIEFGMAEKYIDDLSRNVRRGNRAKLEKGGWPGRAPHGYVNDRLAKTVLPDPDRFALLRRAWELLLTGQYSVTKIHDTLTHRWGFRTRPTPRRGDRPLSLSGLHRIFTNPFYCGWMASKAGRFQGTHEPMVSQTEFDRVQEILGLRSVPKLQRHAFAFSGGLIRCGECGCAITGEHQVNRQGHHYDYYRCTRKKAGARCRQPFLRAAALEAQVADTLGRLAIPEPILRWTLKYLAAAAQDHRREARARLAGLAKATGEADRHLAELTRMRYRGLLEDTEYLKEKASLLTERARLEEAGRLLQSSDPAWLQPTSQAFVLARHAREWFLRGTPEEKREILACVGSNLLLRERILHLEMRKPFQLILEGSAALPADLPPLEPAPGGLTSYEIQSTPPFLPIWCAQVENGRTLFRDDAPKTDKITRSFRLLSCVPPLYYLKSNKQRRINHKLDKPVP